MPYTIMLDAGHGGTQLRKEDWQRYYRKKGN